jgi:hypothetical protein
MSTTGITTWAVDLKDIGAIYPFQGTEVLMVIVGLVFWIGFHVIQMRQEAEEIEDEMKADGRGEQAKKFIDDY